MGEFSSQSRGLLDRLRVQMAVIFLLQIAGCSFALPFSGGMPAIMYYLNGNPQVQNTALLFGFAGVIGLWCIRHISEYPGTKIVAYYIPVMTLAYIVAAITAFAFRIEYVRPIVLYSFIAALAWLHFDYFFRLRGRKLHLAIVDGGNLRNVTDFKDVTTTRLLHPSDHVKSADMVIADLHHAHSPSWERYLARCVIAGMPVHDVKSVVESLSGKTEFEHLSENSFGSVLPSSFYLKLKYFVDVVICIAVMPIVAVVLAVAAVLVYMESGSPVLFKQQRMGFRGRPFTMYKLRSMRQNSTSGPKFTNTADTRITPLGRILRKYRIDELPQIWNILKGDMSWIGPRPEAIELSVWYDKEIPHYIYRHAVRPGITGWAQVNQGNVAQIEAATEKLRYDFYYIKNFSPWLDVLIALKTFRTIVGGVGSK